MRTKMGGFIVGILLVLIGGVLLAYQFVPEWQETFGALVSWPLIIIAFGLFFLFLGLLLGISALAIPAAIVGGIGGLLMYQNASGDWESWAYAWLLIPGFIGLGFILAGVLDRRMRLLTRLGFWFLMVSLICFSVLGSLLGGPQGLDIVWSTGLIIMGGWFLFRALGRN